LDDRGKKHWVVLGEGMAKVSTLGVVDCSRLIGKQEGEWIAIADRRFVLLRPGAIEFMESLERAAQVITAKDAATILFRLDLKCGDVAVEAGVGSGSMTTALLNAVAPNGKVISIELREDMAARARKNISRIPLSKCWDLRLGNIISISIDTEADVVILDIPNPWDALDNVELFLRPGGRFCAYLPNTNQVETTVRALRKRGYVEIEVLENIQRAMEVHESGIRPSFEMLGHTGYLTFARKTKLEQEKG
ncbi:MAG: tRNA (adenine-N1)-methyltransferase, partial [Methanomassiliicoccales archaeon]|nr:tRNA (adenine-N1)-methyltransferase [Methanomassiliicoccales archaeon]